MTTPRDPTDSRGAPLLEGTRVEVRTGFERDWTTGFQVEAVSDTGYRLRRRSDKQVLPVEFAFADVRRERKNSMWWY
jgi:hypothetical protein